MSQFTAIQTAARNIATGACILVRFAEKSPEEALTLAAEGSRKNARDCAQRTGIWASTTTSEQIEAALFQGSVAADILDGTISRPSTGNVREYALAAVREVLAND